MISTVLLSVTTIINGQDMDFNFLSSFLFHPRKSYQDMDEKDIQINVGDSVQVGSRFHFISKSAPTILFFHKVRQYPLDHKLCVLREHKNRNQDQLHQLQYVQ